MPLDFIVNSSVIQTPGNIVTPGTVFAGTLSLQETLGTPQAVATGSAAILIPSVNGNPVSVVRISAAAATTGASLPAGTLQGQILVLIITTAAANTVTMAASGTSNVAAGTTAVLAGLEAHMFVWDTITALWYIVGPAAN